VTDLAARHLGASIVAASDDSFGPKEALLRPGHVEFVPGTYDHKGEVVDGWETRRRRDAGTDWVVIRLGVPGVIGCIDVDTTSFTGNAPTACWVEACGAQGPLLADELIGWEGIVGRTPLRPDAHNRPTVSDSRAWTHLRLWADPDGGIGRVRVEGEPLPDPRWLDRLGVDLVAEQLGGRVLASTDEFYSPAAALLRPDRPRSMGEGWEARRRRGPGHDSVTIALGVAGRIRVVEVDTSQFIHNASARFALWTAHVAPAAQPPPPGDPGWRLLLAPTRLVPDAQHRFPVDGRTASHARLDAYPDGGMARLRLHGTPDPDARAALGVRWFDTLPRPQALEVLDALPAALADCRPFRDRERLIAQVTAHAHDSGPATAFLRSVLGG